MRTREKKPQKCIEVRVGLKPGVMDAEAVSAEKALRLLGIQGIEGVRMARIYEITFTDISSGEALARASESVERLLANPVIHEVFLRELKK